MEISEVWLYKYSKRASSSFAFPSLTYTPSLSLATIAIVKNSFQMIPPSKVTYQSLINSSSSTLDDGTHATNASTADSVPIIRSFLHSPSSVVVARGLQGEEAQEIIDTIDQVGIMLLQHGDAP